MARVHLLGTGWSYLSGRPARAGWPAVAPTPAGRVWLPWARPGGRRAAQWAACRTLGIAPLRRLG